MPRERAPNRAGQHRRKRWNRASILAALQDWVERYGEVPDRVDWDRHMCRRRGHHAKLARLDAHPQPLPSPAPVLRSFGTWQAALAAAGYQARYLPRRLREDEREVTVALYQSGLSTGQIAERLGVAPKSVRERLDRAGVARDRSRSRRPPQRWPLPAQQQAAIVAMALDGATLHQLAERFGLPIARIREVLATQDASAGRTARRIRASLKRLDPSALTDQQREVVDLVVIQRLTYAQASRRLGVAPSTIARRLQSAIKRPESP